MYILNGLAPSILRDFVYFRSTVSVRSRSSSTSDCVPLPSYYHLVSVRAVIHWNTSRRRKDVLIYINSVNTDTVWFNWAISLWFFIGSDRMCISITYCMCLLFYVFMYTYDYATRSQESAYK